MSPGRSSTGNHILLPSNFDIPRIPLNERSIAKITGGVVLWRIWPAVLLHAVFAAIIVALSKYTAVHLGIPNVLLTLLGVVIGFVISLRVSSGYDRYWWGRCAWSDLVKLTRTMSRLVWIHVPPRINKVGEPTRYEVGQTMREKRVALELMEAFAVALKHYLRGELGIYYDDLYHLARPFHEHHDHDLPGLSSAENPHLKPLILPRRPSRQFSIESYSQLPPEAREQLKGPPGVPPSVPLPPQRSSSSGSDLERKGKKLSKSKSKSREGSSTTVTVTDPDSSTTPLVVSHSHSPPELIAVDAPSVAKPTALLASSSYGSIKASPHTLRHESSRTSLASSHSGSGSDGERESLLPAEIPGPATGVREDLVPFMSVLSTFGRAINPYFWYKAWRAHWREGLKRRDPPEGVNIRDGNNAPDSHHPSKHHHRHRRANRQTHTQSGKHRPAIAGDGENLPLEILRCLSEWVGILDGRDVASGGVVGGLYGCLTGYEDILATLERILTTPLPYVYSAHIRHTVWLYLFFLPFQLADDFSWYTVPGTAVAAFFYLGFIAAGDEIEQPFGYDENDLDLDLFCRDIIRADLHSLLMTPFPNAPHGSSHILDSEIDVNEASTVVDVSLGKHHHHHLHV